LIGSGIGTSLSPALHEHEGDELGLRYFYRLRDLAALGLPPTAVGDVLAAVRLAGFDGVNVTHPVKQLVLDHLDRLSPDAAAIGAVNTVVFDDGGATGHNTDLPAFVNGLRAGLPDAPLDRVAVAGAGGAGAAVVHGLASLGAARIRIFDVDRRRAQRLATQVSDRHANLAPARPVDTIAEAVEGADGVINATPVGMEGHPGAPIPIDLLRPDLWVADVVYRPLETELIAAARARGCRVLDGGRMTVFQAVESFRLFTGMEPDADRMLHHFADLIESAYGRRWAHAGH
jgi:shikimate dehydrogenase